MAHRYTVQGQASHITWFIHRLTAQGIAITCTAPLSWLPDAWNGLYVSTPTINFWLDTDSINTEMAAERQWVCKQHLTEWIELDGLWHAHGVAFGFMLLLGSPVLPAAVVPLLDALAPLPGAWLRCGPQSSAHYTRTVLDIILSSWQKPYLSEQSMDWVTHIKQQWQHYEELIDLSRHYLQQHRLSAPIAANQDFSTPPTEQAHFAANLARTIILFTLENNSHPLTDIREHLQQSAPQLSSLIQPSTRIILPII